LIIAICLLLLSLIISVKIFGIVGAGRAVQNVEQSASKSQQVAETVESKVNELPRQFHYLNELFEKSPR
jgi:cell division protein FtsB